MNMRRCIEVNGDQVTRENLLARGVTPNAAEEILAFAEYLRAACTPEARAIFEARRQEIKNR